MKLATGKGARMVIVSEDYSFPDTTPYSVELWVITGVQRDYTWLGATEKPIGGARNGWSLLVNAGGVPLYEVWRPNGDGGSSQVRGLGLSATSLPAGRFGHLVMTYDGTNVRGYVDGVLTTTFPTTAAATVSSLLSWGCRSDLGYCADDWTFDELAVYDVVLDVARVNAHYDLGK